MKQFQTSSIPEDSFRHRYLRQRDYNSGGTASLDRKSKIIVLVRGIPEKLLLRPGKSVYIGRFHPENKIEIDLDLSPYGGSHAGVSRVHASLDIAFNRLFLTDLNSTNGTLMGGERLKPHFPRLIRNGAEVLMGNLLMSFHFPTSN